MIRLLLLQTLLVSGLSAQARPIFDWHLDKTHLDGSSFRPDAGQLALRVGDAPVFHGQGETQCLLRRQADPIATANGQMPSASLPKQAITAEAWVAIDVAQEWGGILGALEDNGADERGWLLGFRNRNFSFALSSKKKQRLTYLTATSRFELGRFHHVVGTYDGARLRLYVDGELAAQTQEQGGPIFYADVHKFVAGAYHDLNENYRMQGALLALRVYDSALSARRVKALYRKGSKTLPEATGATFTKVPKKAYPALTELQPKINTAIGRGVEHILRQQNRDGSWDFKLSSYRNGSTALAVYALAKSGVPAEHPSIQAALRFLRARDPVKVYSFGCQLLALASVGNKSKEHREWARRLTTKLVALESRTEPGGWAYPSGSVDLSNTQFAALGFFGAAQLDVDIAPEVWRRMVKKTTLHQPFLKATTSRRAKSSSRTSSDEKIGGYTYFTGGRQYPESGSMTTAGLCVLALADRLCKDGLGGRTLRSLHRSKTQALRWLADNFTVSTNPGYPSTVYYYLYGVERVGALLELEEIGDVPWYRAGADWLTRKQAKDGGWDRFDQTCFALLFLTRATAPVTGLATRKPEVWTTEGEAQLAATGRVKCSMWIAGFDEKRRAQKLHIRRVRYQIDGREIGVVIGDPKRAWTSESYLFQHRFPTPGPRKLSAIVELESGETIRSASLEVDAGHDVEAWMQGNLDRMAHNLLLDVTVQIGATSSAKDHTARAALDGLDATAWLCQPNDTRPKLKLGWKKPIRANRVVLFPADCRLPDSGRHDHVRRVALLVNRRRIEVTCPQDPIAATVIDLEGVRAIRSIEVQILQRTPGGAAKGHAGFAEVALQLIGKKR